MFALALPARAQDAFLDTLAGLGGGFGAQAEAAERLGTLGDPRAIAPLRALSDGRLLRRADGTLLIRADSGTTEAATGAAAVLARSPRSSAVSGTAASRRPAAR